MQGRAAVAALAAERLEAAPVAPAWAAVRPEPEPERARVPAPVPAAVPRVRVAARAAPADRPAALAAAEPSADMRQGPRRGPCSVMLAHDPSGRARGLGFPKTGFGPGSTPGRLLASCSIA